MHEKMNPQKYLLRKETKKKNRGQKLLYETAMITVLIMIINRNIKWVKHQSSKI